MHSARYETKLTLKTITNSINTPKKIHQMISNDDLSLICNLSPLSLLAFSPGEFPLPFNMAICSGEIYQKHFMK